MRKFMDDDFVLLNDTAKKLYHGYAKEMPVYDYHCHLNPKEIAEDKAYRDITELWLGGDHYKWRAMRSNGVAEDYITGNKPPKEKFMKWAETMPYCIGNPLYHWTHLELQRYFGIYETLSPKTAENIWEKCNELLQTKEFTARELIKRSNVKVICTTDDPIDDLRYHKQIAEDSSFETKVFPTFRPDKSFNIEKEGFSEWITKLSEITGREINSFSSLLESLGERIEYFHEVGCRLSDHALDPVMYKDGSVEEADAVLKKGLAGESLSAEELQVYKGQIMLFLGKKYTELNWVMQIHIGTFRNNSTKMFKLLGPDTGFDSISDKVFAEDLIKLLDSLDCTDQLPKTILYNLNPRENEVLGTMIGCFQGGAIPGKIQFGSGWWFLDQKDGMQKQMVALANLGLLSRFVGMLTDSRSFLSYTRHEYFRRILCNLLGTWVEEGEAPNDMELLGKMVQDICFNNSKGYFDINLDN
jgi:glucuronate isomerase